MAESSEDQILSALQHAWDGSYEFGLGVDGYWARRRDGLGGMLIEGDPGELQRMVSEDYAMRPTRRRPDDSGSG